MFGAVGLYAGNITVHTIGDSTMANYDESVSSIRGWCMMLQQFFKNGVVVNNRGKAGASSKSFYLEAPYWASVKKQIKKGDYVFIQFGHNDEKNGGLDGDTLIAFYKSIHKDTIVDYRGTNASGTYVSYLKKYVNETRALGATPILISPMCRKYFNGGTITRTGRHDLGDRFKAIDRVNVVVTDKNKVSTSNHTYDYPYQMQQVAKEMNVHFIDITSLTKKAYEGYGADECKQLLFVSTDGTHPTGRGGTLVARLCAKELKQQGILADYIDVNSALALNPTKENMGEAYVGQSVIKEFILSCSSMEPSSSGTVTVTASDGFSVSTSKDGNFSQQISYDYANKELAFHRFYVKIQQSVAGTYTGKITATCGENTKSADASAKFVSSANGTSTTAYWKLGSNTFCSLSGVATAVEESFNEMKVQRYAAPGKMTVWPTASGYEASRVTQRSMVASGVWPANEIDEVSTRYIQFGIKANEGTVLNIDSIGLYVGGSNGNGMHCRISYSTNDDFSDAHEIAEYQTMPANNMLAVNAKVIISLSGGKILYLRIYPWYNTSAHDKAICISDVAIHGVTSLLKK
jgi:lysophospholipase L1-like esterase